MGVVSGVFQKVTLATNSPNFKRSHTSRFMKCVLVSHSLPLLFLLFPKMVKVATVIGGGFYATVLAVAWAVLGVRKLQPTTAVVPMRTFGTTRATTSSSGGVAKRVVAATPAKPFSDKTVQTLRQSALAVTATGLLASRSAGLAGAVTPLIALGMVLATFHNFVWGARLPKRFTQVCHPLVTGMGLTWLNLQVLGFALGKTFKEMIRMYKSGKLGWTTAGAGDVLLFLLGPAIISLSCQMYERRKLMRENMVEVGTAIGVSTFGGLFGTAALIRLFRLGAISKAIGLSLISRNITSALAMVSGSVLGADVCLSVSIAILTGLLGANFGASILDKWNITDPVARGLAIGASSHGLGTAAIKDEKDAFPFAAISMALTASISTVIVSIPFFRTALIKLALGA
jgi:putative effector of murein hydrolase